MVMKLIHTEVNDDCIKIWVIGWFLILVKNNSSN